MIWTKRPALPDGVESPNYYARHVACPYCGARSADSCEVTTLGIVSGPDFNRAQCTCGWSGTVHQLVGLSIHQTIRNTLITDLIAEGWRHACYANAPDKSIFDGVLAKNCPGCKGS